MGTGFPQLLPSADGQAKNIRFVLTCRFRKGFRINDFVWLTTSCKILPYCSCTLDEEHPISRRSTSSTSRGALSRGNAHDGPITLPENSRTEITLCSTIDKYVLIRDTELSSESANSDHQMWQSSRNLSRPGTMFMLVLLLCCAYVHAFSHLWQRHKTKAGCVVEVTSNLHDSNGFWLWRIHCVSSLGVTVVLNIVLLVNLLTWRVIDEIDALVVPENWLRWY
jgi:hypothetical protein